MDSVDKSASPLEEEATQVGLEATAPESKSKPKTVLNNRGKLVSASNCIIEKETAKHREAFLAYANLGPDRSYRKTANQLKVSLKSIRNWAASFNWQERVAEFDKTIFDRLEEKAIDDATKRKLQSLAIVSEAKDKWLNDFRKGKIKPHTVRDLEVILNLEMKLLDIAPPPDTVVNVLITDAVAEKEASIKGDTAMEGTDEPQPKATSTGVLS